MALRSVARTLSRCFTWALCSLTLSLLSMQQPGGQVPMNPKDDPFSPENIAQVAEEISKLTPEQQEQLYKESLDFLSKELNLNPEEVEKMIMEEFTQGAPMPDMPQPTGPAATVLPAEEPAPKRQKVEEKIVPVKDLNDVATLLKNLADLTDTIMRKASGLPDLPSRIDRWVEQKKLTSWQTGLTWARFKQQLELLVQKLGKLQHKEPRTNTYLYLPELLNNISLKNNLERIYRTLKKYNEAFTTSSFDIDTAFDDPLGGAGSLSAEAKDALLGILNTYGEAFYMSNLLKECDALIQKFEPAAQKIRTAEEEKAKKALEESKKPRTAGSIKQAGSRGGDRYDGGNYYGEPSNGGGYYPGSSYSPGYSYGGYPSTSDSDSKTPSDTKESDAKGSEKKAAMTDTKKDKDDISSGRYKWMADLSKEIASDINALGQVIINDFAPTKLELVRISPALDATLEQQLKNFTFSGQKIESNLKTLTDSSSSINFSSAVKEQLFAPIVSSYNTYQQGLQDVVKKLADIAAEKIDPLAKETELDSDTLTKFSEVSLMPLGGKLTRKAGLEILAERIENPVGLNEEQKASLTNFAEAQTTILKEQQEKQQKNTKISIVKAFVDMLTGLNKHISNLAQTKRK